MRKFARWIVAYAGWVAGIGTLLAVIGGYYSVQLYKNLRTDIEELLPTTSRSVRDLDEVTSRLNSIENIVILIFSQDIEQSKKFIIDLSKKLESVSPDIISSVEYRIDREIQFFRDRRSLFIDLADLIRIKEYISKRIQYEKELYNPLNLFKTEELMEPVFDFSALKKKYENKVGGFDHLPGGFYATPDQKVRLLIAYMPGKGLDKALQIKSALEKAVNELQPKKYASDLEVKFTGNIENLIEESAALVEDLELSTVIVVILVTLAMLIFYKDFKATFALVSSLFMGTFWSFGLSYFLVGYLNANTAFLASIVIGNGINFGIIFLARYIESRKEALEHGLAIEEAMVHTVVPTLTAALAAGFSYGSLVLTGFRGFNQFGVIGLVGMICCWLSAYTLLPVYLTLLNRWFKLQWVAEPKVRFTLPTLLAHFVEKFSPLVCVGSALAIAFSAYQVGRCKESVIETDLSKLRDKRSSERGSGALYHYIDDIFQHSVSPMVVLPKHREESRKIASLLKSEQQSEGKKRVISSVQVLDDFVPGDQLKKIKVLKEIRKLLPLTILSRLTPIEQTLVNELLSPKSMQPFLEKDLPPLILSKFREKDGSVGKIVLVDKTIDRHHDDSRDLVQFVKLGRDITDSIAPQTAVAGQLPISSDMFEAILKDGPKATFCAFIAVVVLVVVLFRRFKSISLILFALGMGVLWFSALILVLRLKINFLNFIALPITFGIGVDYGVNIFQRYIEEGPGSIIKVIQNTGGAVILSSMTTIIGYSSLLIAGNQAFVSFGQLAVLGEITCVFAAVVALPAFMQWVSLFRRTQ